MNSSIKKHLLHGALVTRGHHRTFLNNQRGVLLIGIIVTIVIISALSGGLVYIFSSATLNPVTGNFARRAYHNAEAGINYVKALYRNAENPTEGKTAIQSYETETTINMPDGGSAKVTISGLTSNYVPARATYFSGSGNTITLTPTSGTFPDERGFFKKEDSGTIYRYTGKTTDNGNIILTGISPDISASASQTFITNEQITIESEGSVGTGLWSVNRQISYIWPLSGSKHGVADTTTPYPPDNRDVRKFEVSAFNETIADIIAWAVNLFRDVIAWFVGKDPQHITDTDVLQWWFTGQNILPGLLAPNSGCGLLVQSWGTYQWDEGANAIKVNESTAWIGGMGGFFLPYSADFRTERANTNGRLNYDAQTKMKVDGWLARHYLIGLSVRADSRCWASGWDPVIMNQYGISYAKGHNNMFDLPTDTDPYLVFWRSVGNSFRLIAYKKLSVSDGVLDGIEAFNDPMDTTNGWTVTTSGVDDGIAWAIESPASTYYRSAPSARHVSTVPDHILSGYVWDQWIANMTRSMPLEGVSDATVSFWHRKGATGYFHASAFAYFQFDYNGDGTWDDLTEMQFEPSSDWQQAEHTFSNKPFTSNTKCRLRINVLGGVLGGRADFYIDDLQIKASRLKDWATLGVRVRETGTTGSMSNEFEIFYGHPSGNNGTGPNDIVVDVNRAACPRDQNCWLPQSPINTMTWASDKLTVASSTTSDPSVAADNPWYWWYDADHHYRNGGYISTLAKGNQRTTEDNCYYTLESGGSKEPYVIIKTHGSNCRTTDTYYLGSNNPEEFALHLYSNMTWWNTWFDDTNILWTNRSSSYGSGIQY